MTLLKRLSLGYKLPRNVIVDMIELIKSYPNNKIISELPTSWNSSVLLCSCLDYLTKKPINYIAFDEFRDVSRYIIKCRLPGLHLNPEGLQIAILNRENLDFESWLNSVKTDKSIINGAKYKSIKWIQMPIYDKRMIAAGANKKEKFALFDYVKNVQLVTSAINAHTSFAQIGYIDDEYLCAINYISGTNTYDKKSTYVPFIDVTSDEKLQKKYKPMLMAHTHAVRTWYTELNTELINFGNYFPYKDNLSFEYIWHPGVTIDENFIPYNGELND